ncbi:hypothetical protein [Halioglobus maricola]|uniref:hypothetical protein n=1 Tax=Halioglobus maricola TaxID=2601894 RepID=UPI00197AFAB0|nr:hypothetical protein [Halioglobus maricola]
MDTDIGDHIWLCTRAGRFDGLEPCSNPRAELNKIAENQLQDQLNEWGQTWSPAVGLFSFNQ